MFTPKNELMISITPEIYQSVAAAVLAAVEGKEFFNGSVECDTDEFYSTLRMTLILYRDKGDDKKGGPAGPSGDGALRDVVPVWWEFSLSQPSGEVETDFSWRELKPYLV